MNSGPLEAEICQIEQEQHQLTLMDGRCGVSIKARDKDFIHKFLFPSKTRYTFISGGLTDPFSTDTSLLIPQEDFSKFLGLLKEYTVGCNRNTTIGIITDDNYNMFTDKQKPVTYLLVNDMVTSR